VTTEQPTYVIVTPAFNEAAYIERTIESVLHQTVRPVRWVVVDDGSTDQTPQIVQRYARQYDWMRYLRRERVPGQAYYASNVYAIQEGLQSLAEIEYEFLAILDADISLPCDYYEAIISRFRDDPLLGIASGVYENLINGRRHPVLHDRQSTPKAIMVLRRACFEDIGGLLPLPCGGEDTCACVMARIKGWKAWSFPDVEVLHHRPTGTGSAKSILCARFKQGLADCGVGSHPLFVLAKTLRRCVRERPYLIGGVLRLLGFAYGCLCGIRREVPIDVVRFLRREQLLRLLTANRISRLCQPNQVRRSERGIERI